MWRRVVRSLPATSGEHWRDLKLRATQPVCTELWPILLNGGPNSAISQRQCSNPRSDIGAVGAKPAKAKVIGMRAHLPSMVAPNDDEEEETLRARAPSPRQAIPMLSELAAKAAAGAAAEEGASSLAGHAELPANFMAPAQKAPPPALAIYPRWRATRPGGSRWSCLTSTAHRKDGPSGPQVARRGAGGGGHEVGRRVGVRLGDGWSVGRSLARRSSEGETSSGGRAAGAWPEWQRWRRRGGIDGGAESGGNNGGGIDGSHGNGGGAVALWQQRLGSGSGRGGGRGGGNGDGGGAASAGTAVAAVAW